MRKIFGLATALLGLLAFVAVATADTAGPSASGLIQSLEVTHSPGTPKKPTKVKVTVELKKQDGSKPVFNKEADVHLPPGMGLNYKKFPKCQPSKLENTTDKASALKACKKAQVGSGSGTADATDFGLGVVTAPVLAFNGPPGKYILWADSPVQPDVLLVGTLSGTTLKIPIPQKAPLCPISPDQCAPITKFTVTTGKTIKVKKGRRTKKVAYLTNPKKCPSGGYPWSIDFTYINGEKLSPADKAAC
jgi:hypothetical protein